MLDLDHLSRQTGGDRNLQRQVLELFLRQIDSQVREISPDGDQQKLRDLAHGIVGSAKAIGAFDLAQVAGRICSNERIRNADIADLTASVDQTTAFIVIHLAR